MLIKMEEPTDKSVHTGESIGICEREAKLIDSCCLCPLSVCICLRKLSINKNKSKKQIKINPKNKKNHS